MRKTFAQRRRIAGTLLVIFLIQTLYPATAWALTGGPSQPEFSGFEPVGATDMVNKFTGDFTYTLPVMEVPGPQGSSYPLTLAYHSGANAEEDASWVGYGWSLSPGAINRSARGIPDDFQGELVAYSNKMPDNYTLSATADVRSQAFGIKGLPGKGSASVNQTVRYNNQTGFGLTTGIGISLMEGLVSLGVQESNNGDRSFSAQINPMALISLKEGAKGKMPPTRGANKMLRSILTRATQINLLGGSRGILDYNEINRSTRTSSYTGSAFTFGVDLTGAPFLAPIGATAGLSGTYAKQSTPKEPEKMAEYGYLYADAGNAQYDNYKGSNILSDYYVEKESSYNVRDSFLGIPFHNADYYNVSGEGLGGVFQLHHPKIGDFAPNSRTNHTSIKDIGVDVTFGPTWGIGGSYNTGQQTLTEGSWANAEGYVGFNRFSSESQQVKAAPYFRFVNDLGGQVGPEKMNDDNPISAIFDKNKKLNTKAVDEIREQVARGGNQQGAGSGTFIGRHSVEEAEKNAMFRYCKRTDIYNLRYKPNSNKEVNALQNSALAEFQITNETGQQYTYGLPVYARKESNMQYGLIKNVNKPDHNFLAYVNKNSELSIKNADDFIKNTPVAIGDYRESAYATNYLLTEITTPDFVDRNFNGPDEQDFGGYTAFHYVRKYGKNGDWYHWRSPYLGMQHNRGSLSDGQDDTGSVNEGEKEVFYLKSVRTKTHTAVFTIEGNEYSARLDGYDAVKGSEALYDKSDISQSAWNARHKLYSLRKIELYPNEDIISYDDQGECTVKPQAIPLKKVEFTYDYSLCKGTPNSNEENGGKLTLKSIKTYYNNIAQGKPVEFIYNYPDVDKLYPSIYRNLKVGPFLAEKENPYYDKYSLDSWGSYQSEGSQRRENLQTWPSQKANSEGEFDPAAWQLKVIKLPSGGEIHVQYEQKDYQYVQDKMAHGLASLSEEMVSTSNEFYIDPTSVGISLTSDDVLNKCVKEIEQRYVKGGDKIYFKFLYNLLGNFNSSNPVNSCNAEYISGYSTVTAVKLTDKKLIKITLGKSKYEFENNITGNDYNLPSDVCVNFVQSQRLGKLVDVSDENNNCAKNDPGFDINNEEEAKVIMRQFFSWIRSEGVQRDFQKGKKYCAELKRQLSYFKIPMPHGKKGGGIRVKRLLTFEPGSFGKSSVLYGQEYDYRLPDGSSSGVATTEPASMREENALVHIIPRLSQSFGSKIIAGVDRENAEGPIGESLLPAASVGYSRVTVSNIHEGKTNPGYSVTEYYTCKDYPVRTMMTPLNMKKDKSNIIALLYNQFVRNVWTAQGFSVILNNMHGQIRREAVYDATERKFDSKPFQGTKAPIQETIYEYFEPKAESTVSLVSDRANADGNVSPVSTFPGKEIDITTAQHAVSDVSDNLTFQGDATLSGLLLTWLTVIPYYNNSQSLFYSHTTSKVVRYPAILKQVTSRHDGIEQITENLAFDTYTGKPVVTRTADGGKGGYVQQQVMGTWVYPRLRAKIFSEGQVVTASALTMVDEDGGLYLKPQHATNCDLLAAVHEGDVLALGDYQDNVYYAEAPDVAQRRIRLYPAKPATAEALQPSAIKECAKVSILFSGLTNELSTAIGSTTTHLATLNRSDKGLPSIIQQNSSLAAALNAVLQNQNRPNRITLNGPFTNIHIAGFRELLPPSFVLKEEGETVSELKFDISKDAVTNELKIKLLSFKVAVESGEPVFVFAK